MPYESYLLEGEPILYTALIDPFTTEDMEAMWTYNREIRERFTRKLHVLLDVQRLKKGPPHGAIRGWRESSLTHENAGNIALVGANAITRFIANTVLWMAKFDRLQFFETQEDGLAYLRHIVAQEDAE